MNCKRFLFFFLLAFQILVSGKKCYAEIYTLSDYDTEIYSYDMETVTESAIGIMPYSAFSPYQGTIGSPYIEYMRDYAISTKPSEHYVIFITQESIYSGGQTRTSLVYNYAVGDITYNGSQFVGSVQLRKIYASTNYFPQFSTVTDNNFTLNPGTYLVYTDLESNYPDLAAQDMFPQNLFYLGIFVLLSLVLKQFFRR